ncbi:MAG: AlpA family phage regulatory protein [Gemmataceae bacterium]|nr:AlpA family phage regulatory protein [Gemmataceae bacterium]
MEEKSSSSKSRSRVRLAPGLLRRKGAAEYCSISPSTWDRMTSAGETPEPIRLGGIVGWNRRELTAWIDAGCPSRNVWAPIWQAMVKERRTTRK